MWEKRYPLFKPQRAGNRYREFDDEDVQLLLYIRQQIEQGRSIGELAAEGREALLRRIAPPVAHLSPEQQAYTCLIEELLDSIRQLEKTRLETRLAECAVHYSFATLLHMVFVPLMHRLGALWAAQELSIASEHFATMLLKQRLLAMLQAAAPGGDPPLLLCACPAGEFHELGLLSFAYTMQQDGWQVCYLGADLPVPDLLYSCQRLRPALVALSLTHAAEARGCLDVWHDIDAMIARAHPTFVGGQALEVYQQVVRPRHALCFSTLQEAQTHARHLYAGLVSQRQTVPAPGKAAV
jgi:methanogenic corrinoid protein MtbC1